MTPTRAQREQRQRVMALLESRGGVWTIERMAQELGIAPRTMQNWIWRLRWKKTAWRGWYTTGAASQVTGLSPQWLSSQCRAGKLRCRRPPRSLRHPRYSWWLIAPEDVEQLMRERRPELLERVREAYFD